MPRVANRKIEPRILNYVKGMTFEEVIADSQKKDLENSVFAQKTGLCAHCKKNKHAEKSVICSECKKNSQDTLKGLMGESGLAMFNLNFPE